MTESELRRIRQSIQVQRNQSGQQPVCSSPLNGRCEQNAFDLYGYLNTRNDDPLIVYGCINVQGEPLPETLPENENGVFPGTFGPVHFWVYDQNTELHLDLADPMNGEPFCEKECPESFIPVMVYSGPVTSRRDLNYRSIAQKIESKEISFPPDPDRTLGDCPGFSSDSPSPQKSSVSMG